MQAIFNALIPIFIIILLGYISSISKIMSQSTSKIINDYVFYIGLPALFFKATATAPIEKIVNLQFIGVNFFGFLASFLIAIFVCQVLFKNTLSILAFQGLTSSFSNGGYMGVPLTIAAFGEVASLPAAIAALVLGIFPITLVVLLLEISADDNKNLQDLFIHTIKTILSNPLVLAVLFGAIFTILDLNLPSTFEITIKLLSETAGPCALFSLGFGIVSQSANNDTNIIDNKQISLVVFIKLIFTLEPLLRNVAVLFAALPTGIATYVLAQKYNIYIDSVARAILISTLISILSLTAILATFTT